MSQLRQHIGFGSMFALCAMVALSAAHAQNPVGSSAQAGAAGKRWAVLIGVEDYQSANDLPYVKNDVTRLAETLEIHGGMSRGSQCALVDGAKPSELPTRENLMTQVPKWLEKCQPGDQIIVYFSGHGVQDKDGKLYLAPSDIDPQQIAKTGLPLQWFRDQIAACKATTKLLILDACHAGTDKGEKPEGQLVGQPRGEQPESQVVADAFSKPFEELNGVITLCSSTARETSQIWPQREQSLFSYWLNQGLKGHADANVDEKVDVDELFRYVENNVRRTAAEVLDHPQHPVRKILPDVVGVPVVIQLCPLSSKRVLTEVAEELAWAMKDRQLTKVGLLELSNDTQFGDVLRADCGLLGRRFAGQIQQGLLAAAPGKLAVVEAARVARKLKGMQCSIDDLADGTMLQKLAADPDAVPVLVRGVLFSRAGRVLNIRCELKDTVQGTVLASAGGTMLLTPSEWAELGRSANLPPEANEPPPPQPGAEPQPGTDPQADQVVEHLDQQSQGPHPMAPGQKSDYGIRILVKKPDGTLEERKPRFKGNDCYITLRKGEVFEIHARCVAPNRVLMRLLVDGLNTMVEDAGGPPGEELETVEVPKDDRDPSKGVVLKVIGKRVSLDEARPWVLDPERRDSRNPWYPIKGFVSTLGAAGKVRQFEVVDASQSLAAERQFTDQIGLITAAFYAPKGTARGGDVGVQAGEEIEQGVLVVGGNKTPGNLLCVINIHYGSE